MRALLLLCQWGVVGAGGVGLPGFRLGRAQLKAVRGFGACVSACVVFSSLFGTPWLDLGENIRK